MISINELRYYLKDQEAFVPQEQSQEGLYKEKVFKSLMLDLDDTIYRNLRKVSKEDSFYEIKTILSNNILKEILNTLDDEEYTKEKINLLNMVTYKIDTIAAKVHRYLVIHENKGIEEIIDLINPVTMYNYLMRDVNLELIGSCDLIEISNSRYFPVIRTNKLPDYRVDYSDEIILTGIAMLVEQEFNTESFNGYIELGCQILSKNQGIFKTCLVYFKVIFMLFSKSTFIYVNLN
jgi:CRISPR-associated exonuclease Cas4